ncbi:MAG: hypothetical protein KA137_04140 [Halioglobus sp.]|nr:hypothetical protein [Halioglobus sp.]
MLLWVLVPLGLGLGYAVITRLAVGIGDEDVHRFQIDWFLQGRYELFEHVTVLPLYHLVVAALAQFSGLTSLNGLRLVHMLFAAAAIPAFFALCRALYPAQAAGRTAQFMFIPILFPLFFLTYTDLPGLAFTFLMLERTFRRSYPWAAVFALVAVAMRQPNIVWVAFAFGLVALQVAGDLAGSSPPGASGGRRAGAVPGLLPETLRRGRYLIAVILGFAVFVLWNGGVAIGDVEQHRVALNLSNLYFCLLVGFALFLPFNLGQLGNIRRLLGRHRWLAPVLLACFFAYFLTYEHPHKYNSFSLAFYRHNWFLHYTSDVTAIRIAAFIPMAWMALSFATAAGNSDYRREMLLLVPFALLSMVPLPLIEPRYYYVALCLFLALRPTMSTAANLITLLYYIAVSAYVVEGISRQAFFL